MADSARWKTAQVLELAETSPLTYEWRETGLIWAKAEHQKRRDLLSSNSVMQRTVKLTVRRGGAYPEITLRHALRLVEGHCHPTDIDGDDPGWLTVTAALIEPVACEAPAGGGAWGPGALTFPGILAEKWLRQSQEEPMSHSEDRYMLITPKEIELAAGGLVTAGGTTCAIAVAHTLDPYKNEYEIVWRRDN